MVLQHTNFTEKQLRTYRLKFIIALDSQPGSSNHLGLTISKANEETITNFTTKDQF